MLNWAAVSELGWVAVLAPVVVAVVWETWLDVDSWGAVKAQVVPIAVLLMAGDMVAMVVRPSAVVLP